MKFFEKHRGIGKFIWSHHNLCFVILVCLVAAYLFGIGLLVEHYHVYPHTIAGAAIGLFLILLPLNLLGN